MFLKAKVILAYHLTMTRLTFRHYPSTSNIYSLWQFLDDDRLHRLTVAQCWFNHAEPFTRLPISDDKAKVVLKALVDSNPEFISSELATKIVNRSLEKNHKNLLVIADKPQYIGKIAEALRPHYAEGFCSHFGRDNGNLGLVVDRAIEGTHVSPKQAVDLLLKYPAIFTTRRSATVRLCAIVVRYGKRKDRQKLVDHRYELLNLLMRPAPKTVKKKSQRKKK